MNNVKAADIMNKIKNSLQQIKYYGVNGAKVTLVVSEDTVEAFRLAERLLNESAKTPLLDGKLKVGDEVMVGDEKNGYLGTKFIVTGEYEENDTVYLLNPLNGRHTLAGHSHCRRTGKTYPKLVEAMMEAREGQG